MVDHHQESRRQASIVIPCLNSPVIDRTLRSLLSQECPSIDFVIFVVGRDDQRQIVVDDRVTFIETDAPVSPAAARNLGAARAHGEFLAFIDADCVADPRWLLTLVDAVSQDFGLVVGGSVAFDKVNFWTFIDNFSTFHDVMAHLPAGERDQLPSLNLAMRRRDFETIGGFDEHLPHAAGEDSDLTFRMKQAGHRLLFVPGAIVNHHPARSTLRQFLQHAYLRGRFSLLVDPRFVGMIGLPSILRSPWRVLVLSPLMAAYATLRVYLTKPGMGRYLPMSPLLFVSKLAWCFGARRRLLDPDPMLPQPSPVGDNASAGEGSRR